MSQHGETFAPPPGPPPGHAGPPAPAPISIPTAAPAPAAPVSPVSPVSPIYENKPPTPVSSDQKGGFPPPGHRDFEEDGPPPYEYEARAGPSQGPGYQGPSSQGPSSQGPSSQGPSSQGPGEGSSSAPPPGQYPTASQEKLAQGQFNTPPPGPYPTASQEKLAQGQYPTASQEKLAQGEFHAPPPGPPPGAPPAQGQYPPPPGQYGALQSPGFRNLPPKFHVWSSWSGKVPCIELGPEVFGTPIYSAKMGENMTFRAGRWTDNGPIVAEILSGGSFSFKSVLSYNGFRTSFGNTATVDIGSSGVWRFNIPVQGREEAWEWRRTKEAKGGLVKKLGKFAGDVGSMFLVPEGAPEGANPFATLTKASGSLLKKQSELGVFEFHGPALTGEMGDAFTALAIMSLVKLQQDNRDTAVGGMIAGSLTNFVK